MTPARPMLPAVLAHLTDTDASMWSDALRFENAVPICDFNGAGVYWLDDAEVWQPIVLASSGIGESFRSVTTVPWITFSAAFAWEIMQTRGLIPEGYVGRFLCAPCGGTGWQEDEEGRGWCPYCDRSGIRPHPASVADVASFLSLGFTPSDDGNIPGILGFEDIVARDIDHPFRRPVWWVKELDDAEDGRPWCGVDAEVRDGIVCLYVPPLWPPAPRGMLAPEGTVRVVERDRGDLPW